MVGVLGFQVWIAVCEYNTLKKEMQARINVYFIMYKPNFS